MENQTILFKEEEILDDDFEEEEEDDDEYDDEDNNLTTTTAAVVTGSAIEQTPPPPQPQPQPLVTTTNIKKPSPSLDDSRKLFQRLWTDEDEIGLLQGFLDFTTRRGTLNSSYHHETGPFYDQIKNKLQLDFNKNQLVEKLRRLKKKYRTVVTRISSGKDFSFKTPHDQATFEISRKIWSGGGNNGGGGNNNGGSGLDDVGIEDDESNHLNSNELNNGNDLSNSDKKGGTSTQRRRSQKRAAEDDLPSPSSLSMPIQNVIEETVKSCLSPLIKELIQSATTTNNGTNASNQIGGFGGMGLNHLHLNFGGMSFSSGEMIEEKWRKQQILELEVYSKRIELVQDQIKTALDQLRTTNGK